MGQVCIRLSKQDEVLSDSNPDYLPFMIDTTFWSEGKQSEDSLYSHIVNKIIHKPEALIFHVQRIYLCYRLGLAEKLYAALLDLLWILDGKGKLLSQRMVSSCRSVLMPQQVLTLAQNSEKTAGFIGLATKYSVLTTGLSGTDQVLKCREQTSIKRDVLQIAQDYIEYSQLDAAIETLEQAVLEDPHRQELQDELLQLYKASRNNQAFSIMYERLKKQRKLIDGWRQMADYFAQIADEA